ncbi:D(2) dopamine receptor-like [Anneissia japonica]|uniref:D(2) dopamine receptor-like n=1 Tax=Anneissia japonica TaxID=1529436 RepID=UPI0014255972|nr:D(2) dopamine receptor-like [Anneissia japonica]
MESSTIFDVQDLLINDSTNNENNFTDSIIRGYNLSSLTRAQYLARVICFTIIAISSTFANGIVILVYALYRKLRTYESVYIINLAISDFLVSSTVMPINTVYLRNSWELSFELCKIKIGLEHSLLQVSVFTVMAIANDRYKAITNPIQYRFNRDPIRAVKTCILLWMLSFGIWIPLQTIWGLLSGNGYRLKTTCYGLHFVNVYNNIIHVILYFWLPFIVISISSYRVYKAILRRKRNWVNQVISNAQMRSSSNHQENGNTHLEETEMKAHHHTQDLDMNQCNIIHNQFKNDTRPTTSNQRNDEMVLSMKTLVTIDEDDAEIETHQYTNLGFQNQDVGQSGVTNDASPTPQNHRDNELGLHESSLNIKNHDAEILTIFKTDSKPPKNRKLGRVRQTQQNCQGSNLRILKHIVIAYYVTWFPYGARLTLFVALFYTKNDQLNYSIPITPLKWLSFCNSLLNPLIYFISNPKLREHLLKLFTCVRK